MIKSINSSGDKTYKCVYIYIFNNFKIHEIKTDGVKGEIEIPAIVIRNLNIPFSVIHRIISQV